MDRVPVTFLQIICVSVAPPCGDLFSQALYAKLRLWLFSPVNTASAHSPMTAQPPTFETAPPRSAPSARPPVSSATSPLLRLLPGVFLLVALGTGLLLSARAYKIWVWPQNVSVRTGDWQHEFGKKYDLHLPLRDPGIETWGAADYLLGDGRPGVQIGHSGWLYTDEEFRSGNGVHGAKSDDRVMLAKLEYIRQVRDRLTEQGTRLVVALVPAKVRVYPEHLGRKRVPAAKSGEYQDFRAALAGLSIPAPDLWSALRADKAQGDVFLRADTHWTPLGARAAARALALSTAESWPGLMTPDTSFLTVRKPPVRYFGDLLAYVRLGALQQAWGPPRDLLSTEATRQVSPGVPPDDRTPPQVLLVGTSYSANQSWNFQGALEQELSTRVRNASAEGKGPFVPMQAYLDTLPEDAPPRVLVWELPERFLDSPVAPLAKQVKGAS